MSDSRLHCLWSLVRSHSQPALNGGGGGGLKMRGGSLRMRAGWKGWQRGSAEAQTGCYSLSGLRCARPVPAHTGRLYLLAESKGVAEAA